MLDGYETFRDCRITISLTALKVSTLYTIHCDFYRCSNTQNQMCELCSLAGQTAIVSFVWGREKIGSGTLT